MIDVDKLGRIAQVGHLRLEARMISAGTTVKEKQCRPLDHLTTVRYQTHPIDIEKDFCVTYFGAHGRPL